MVVVANSGWIETTTATTTKKKKMMMMKTNKEVVKVGVYNKNKRNYMKIGKIASTTAAAETCFVLLYFAIIYVCSFYLKHISLLELFISI